MTVHVFCGPTVTEEEVLDVRPDAVVHPPVAHGDLLRLELRPGDVVVVIDGYYHQAAPVRHKEILALIDSGIHVVGCASMGALRAAELDVCGMVGHGRVYEMYRDGEIDADDEVAVAHLRTSRFEARNVPLVNMRGALRAAVEEGVVPEDFAQEALATARALYYTERSWWHVRQQLPDRGQELDALVDFLERSPGVADTKRQDALTTLARLPDLLPEGSPLAGEPWRNERIYHWEVDFRGRAVDGRFVSYGDVVRFRQVHDPDFPRTWAGFVRASTGAGDSGPDAEDGAPEHLVQAFVPLRGLHDLLQHAPDLVEDEDAFLAVAEARRINDERLWQGRVRLVERLATTRLEKHLRGLWGLSRTDDLDAAARRRGLGSASEAVAAVRPFFLRSEERRRHPIDERRTS